MRNLNKLNLGRITYQAPAKSQDWAWYGGNHVLLDQRTLGNAKINDTVQLGPYRVHVLEYIPDQNSYLCKRVDRPV